ncbi:hypothetical protein D3C72_1274430 [compost metagenome]
MHLGALNRSDRILDLPIKSPFLQDLPDDSESNAVVDDIGELAGSLPELLIGQRMEGAREQSLLGIGPG